MGVCVKFAVTAALSAIVAGAAGQEWTQVGQRDISGGIGLVSGSQRTLNCTFTPSVAGPAEFYAGTLTKLGVDIGVACRGAMMWLVYVPTSRPAGGLAGSYGGATAEATAGAGVGAKVLVAASNRTVAWQPVSLQGPSGLNGGAGAAPGALTREFFDVEGLIHATGRLS